MSRRDSNSAASKETERLMNRFVRPIYDAIDNRQYKVALKHCAHKKVAGLEIVLVLKAHCLERTGKTNEALEICRAVQKRKPTDDTLLTTMSLVFKLAGCEHEMLPTLEHACAHAEPPSEELFASLFFVYARRGEFLKQQQTALKMFKAFGGVKYMSWASLSMMLQVQHGGAPAKMLALAERMQLKTLRDTKSDDGEALQLLVHIMQLQDKHEDALRTFDELVEPFDREKAHTKQPCTKRSPSAGVWADGAHDPDCPGHSPKSRSAEGKGLFEEEIELGPMIDIDRLMLEASLAKSVDNYARTAAVYQTLLEKHNGDDWTFLKEFIAARFKLGDDFAKVEKDVRAFLTQLQARKGNEQLRGPRLAVIHLLSEKLARLRAVETPKDALAAVETQIEEQIMLYIERFFTKTCCFTDLQQYLALFLSGSESVSNAARARLVDRISKMSSESVSIKSSEDEGDRKGALDKLNRRLLSLKTLRFLGFYDDEAKFPVAELKKLVQALVDEYEATGWLNVGSTGGQREVQNTDNLLLLAAHFLIDAYQRTAPGGTGDGRRRQLLVQAAALLELGLEKSAYNFQMKLLLSRVYGYLGAAEAMLSRHTELDVKHVQLDSLSFLVLDKMLQLCHFPEARRLTDAIDRLHRSTANDTPEYISRSYKTGVYSKVIDMTGFLYQKMKKSHTLAISKGEALLFALFDASANGPSKLHDLLVSPAFEKSVGGLDAMLANADELARNQHREVIVQWTPHAVVPTGDAFPADDGTLVECDRSADFATSVLWLKLRATVAKMLQSAALGETEALVSLENEYVGNLAQLKLVGSESESSSLQQRVWQWSAQAVAAAVKLLAAGDASEGGSVANVFAELQTSFVAIAQQIPAALVLLASSSEEEVALSPYGVSTLSLLLGECGLWTFCLLSVALRATHKKKSKKDDVAALRALLKQLQESHAALETQVGALRFGSSDDAKKNGAAAAGNGDLAAAERKAAANVRASYVTLQSRLTQLLHDRAAAIRLVLQK